MWLYISERENVKENGKKRLKETRKIMGKICANERIIKGRKNGRGAGRDEREHCGKRGGMRGTLWEKGGKIRFSDQNIDPWR
jgi:hypothetical protein